MPRKISSIAPDWWDYTTLDDEILGGRRVSHRKRCFNFRDRDFASCSPHDTLEDFYLTEALEYINAWKLSTPDNPVGICSPIGLNNCLWSRVL